MRSAVLINPPSSVGTTANREGASGLGNVHAFEDGFFYPPHTLATVAAVLREMGWAVTAVDAVAEHLDTEAVVARVRSAPPSYLGVFVSYATRACDAAFLQVLEERLPCARIVALGPSTRFVGCELFDPPLNWKAECRAPGVVVWPPSEEIRPHGPARRCRAVLLGEPERLFGLACGMLDRASLPQSDVDERHPVDGRNLPADGLVCHPLSISGYDAEGRMRDLDGLPFPAWDLFPRERYRFLSVLSSRGCESRCAYCPYVVAQGERFRHRDAQAVVEELHWLIERYCPNRIVFRDPAFAHDRGRVVDICRGILADSVLGGVAGRSFTWECESRPEHFDADLLRLMKMAGCGWVKLGLETTAEGVLAAVWRLNGSGDAEAYRSHVAGLVKTAREIGLSSRLFVMGGLPGQAEADYVETARFVRRIRPTALNVMPRHDYPGLRMRISSADDEAMVRRQMAPLFEVKADLERESAAHAGRLSVRLRRHWRRIGRNLGRRSK